MSLLHFCGEYTRVNFAEKLIEKRINVELKDKYGNSALCKAIFNYKGKYELVKLLIENGAIANSKNNEYKSPLELAILLGDEKLISLLS